MMAGRDLFADEPMPDAEVRRGRDLFADDPMPTQAPSKPSLVLPQKGEHPARKYNTALETARSGLRGLTLGASDVIGAGIAAGAASMSPDVEFGDAYTDIKTDLSADRDAFREQEPSLALGSEIGGAVIPAIATLGTSAPATGTALVPYGVKTAGTAVKSAPSVMKGIGLGAAQGGVYGASQADVGNELSGASDGALLGAAIGGAIPLAGKSINAIISPKSASNTELARLKELGVQPTIGQALGGVANDIEQKLTSIPIAGKKIADQRYAAREQFNTGVMNEVLKPLGMKVNGAGFDAVKDAGSKVSKYYDDELSKIDAVMFDDVFFNQMDELKGMAQGMNEQSARQFERILDSSIRPRMSEAGGMLPEVYKRVQSEIGKAASEVSDRQLSSALKQAGQLLKDQMYRSNPAVAKGLKDADTAFAMLVRVEDAAKRAINSEGVFTPAQLNAAIKAGDKSARKRSIARGEGLLQDDARIGQKILANTEPDSGTMGRLALGGGLLGSGGMAGLLTGSASIPAVLAPSAGIGALRGMYSPSVQNAMVKMVTERSPKMIAAGNKVNALVDGKTANQLRRAAIISASGDVE